MPGAGVVVVGVAVAGVSGGRVAVVVALASLRAVVVRSSSFGSVAPVAGSRFPLSVLVFFFRTPYAARIFLEPQRASNRTCLRGLRRDPSAGHRGQRRNARTTHRREPVPFLEPAAKCKNPGHSPPPRATHQATSTPQPQSVQMWPGDGAPWPRRYRLRKF